jgi:FMN-dependent NADH-azoreductase
VPHLLHIDSSIAPEGSNSRQVARAYADAWRAVHPDGPVTYRDLVATPPPHLTWAAMAATFTPADAHTPEQARAAELREELIAEVTAADEILLAVPMYNFSIPSTFKAWLDHVIVLGRTASSNPGEGVLAGKKVTVVTAQGGSYQPGTPKEGWDHQRPLLAHNLEMLGGTDVEFIDVEMTSSTRVPELAQFVDIFTQSRARAVEAAIARAAARTRVAA